MFPVNLALSLLGTSHRLPEEQLIRGKKPDDSWKENQSEAIAKLFQILGNGFESLF